jgi:hypothetical protein
MFSPPIYRVAEEPKRRDTWHAVIGGKDEWVPAGARQNDFRSVTQPAYWPTLRGAFDIDQI